MSAGIIFLLILALLLVIFTLQNPTTVDLHVFFWNIHEVSLVLALIICLILGVVLALLLSYPKIWKLKGQLKETQKRLTKLEEQNSEALEKPHAEGVEITDGQDDPSFFKD
ncbi:lipopolysaccharide assembly LapA domain-containing protein [Sunxiuqinia elliptica]|uniref:Putative integral membrane protein n=1 Tax=Sunxiuqinia elliptica TaxID=655355 RepID=A0A4R6GUB9_9BACT|nr:LapA family protein [Sunxiuqinia elliptica]TDN99041.1 putative integral membrane protein [Sunxiuqinia elliptica]TDO56481.1 putative integral membrane protein [Sunxiuqinia elliptica]